MALTSQFISAVEDNNLLRIRIMLKDSLLVDKSFIQFSEMSKYAERCGANFWMDKTEELEIPQKELWNTDLMNIELARLVQDFTRERVDYCKNIIRKIYGMNTVSVSEYSSQQTKMQTTKCDEKQNRLSNTGSGNEGDYDVIIKNINRINKILSKNTTSKSITWKYRHIESIQDAAKKIDRACENIKSRRDKNGFN